MADRGTLEAVASELRSVMGAKIDFDMMDNEVILEAIKYHASNAKPGTNFSEITTNFLKSIGVEPKKEEVKMENKTEGKKTTTITTAKKAAMKKPAVAKKKATKKKTTAKKHTDAVKAELTTYGHRKGSQVGTIDEWLEKGKTRSQIVKLMMDEYKYKEAAAGVRLSRLLKHLEEAKGLKVAESDKGEISITGKVKVA